MIDYIIKYGKSGERFFWSHFYLTVVNHISPNNAHNYSGSLCTCFFVFLISLLVYSTFLIIWRYVTCWIHQFFFTTFQTLPLDPSFRTDIRKIFIENPCFVIRYCVVYNSENLLAGKICFAVFSLVLTLIEYDDGHIYIRFEISIVVCDG